ncbi:tol-pal system protein YbgF [Klebsiella variicola]|uniref:Tol-pal system protein YbgF n=1 Tax=Klebsiella variicola TaxID=244366 RepID=A0A7H4MG04_KLEVA|nr:tol-pal system protein YbgF [Klebsiella variicola]
MRRFTSPRWVKNYPKSPKAPDAMFKVGVIMQDKGDTAKAKAVYQQVISKFPGHRRCETSAKTS